MLLNGLEQGDASPAAAMKATAPKE